MEKTKELVEPKNLLVFIVAIILIAGLAFFLFQPQKKSCPQGYVLENNECVKTVSPPGNRVTPGVGEVITGSFSEQYNKMSDLWQDKGIKTPVLQKGFKELTLLPESDLENLKKDIIEFKEKSDNQSIKDLANVYASLVDTAISYKKADKILGEIKVKKQDKCEKLGLYKQFEKESTGLGVSLENFLKQSSSFKSNYPENAKLVGINNPSIPTASFSSGLTNQTFYLKRFESECKEVSS